MNRPPRFIFAPVGEVTPAGGAAAATPAAPTAPQIDHTSHIDEAAALFADKAPAAATIDDESEVVTKVDPDKTAKPDTKSAPAEPPSIFDAAKPKAVPAAEPAKVENPEDKITLNPKAKPETATQFGELKTITKTLRAEADQLRSELAEAKKTPVVSAAAQQENEKLRADYKAAMDRLAVVDLKNTPAFAKQFVEPLNASTEAVKLILADNGMEKVDVKGLLGKSRSEFSAAVNAIAEKLPALDRADFVQEIRNMRAIDTNAANALKNAGTISTEIQQQQVAKARTAFNETLTNLDFVKAGGIGLVEVPANATPEDRAFFEKYNASASSIPAEAEKIAFGGMGEKDVAKVAIEAATFRHIMRNVIPRMDSEYQSMKRQNAELSSKIKELKGSVAAATKDSTSVASGGAKRLDEMGNEEAAAHLFGRS